MDIIRIQIKVASLFWIRHATANVCDFMVSTNTAQLNFVQRFRERMGLLF